MAETELGSHFKYYSQNFSHILFMSLFTLVLYPDHLIYKAHSPHQLPLHVHSAPNSEVNTILEELSNYSLAGQTLSAADQ